MRTRTPVTIFVAMILLVGTGYSTKAIAATNVNAAVKFPPPPPLVIPAPPPVIVVPNTYVYFAPEIEVDLLFYHGYWYRPYQGRWYRSQSYKGPWVYIVHERVPRVLLRLPPDFRNVPPGHRRIPHRELKNNWRRWEREKHWDKPESRHERKERHEMEKGEHKPGRGKGK